MQKKDTRMKSNHSHNNIMKSKPKMIGMLCMIIGAIFLIGATYDLLWRLASIVVGIYLIFYGIKLYQPRSMGIIAGKWFGRF